MAKKNYSGRSGRSTTLVNHKGWPFTRVEPLKDKVTVRSGASSQTTYTTMRKTGKTTKSKTKK